MTDNERIAEAMGWRWDCEEFFNGDAIFGWRHKDKGWYDGGKYYGDPPDYFRDPALLGEMVEWLSNDWHMLICRMHKRGWWSVELANPEGSRDYLFDPVHDELDPKIQTAVARCVLWVLTNEK